MDAVDATGLVIPVSVWVKKLDTEEGRCIVVMEPVERSTASVRFDSSVSHHSFYVNNTWGIIMNPEALQQ